MKLHDEGHHGPILGLDAAHDRPAVREPVWTRLTRWVRASWARLFGPAGEPVPPAALAERHEPHPVPSRLDAKAGAEKERERDEPHRYSEVRALAFDPKTPIGTRMALLARLNPKDMKAVAEDENVPDVIRKAAQKFVNGPEYRPEWSVETDGPTLTEEQKRAYREATANAAKIKKGTES